jgi:hypothetical protein
MDKQSITIKITNQSTKGSEVVLEPWGDCRPIGPGDAVLVRRLGGDTKGIAVDIGEGEIKIWEEGGGDLEFS